MKAGKVILIVVAALYALFWAGGAASYAFLGGPPEGMQWPGPVLVGLAAVLALLGGSRQYKAAALAAAGIGFGSEVLGVVTGFPFGAYHYTDAFAPLFFDVPAVMAAAWLVLAAYSAVLIPLRRNWPLTVVLRAAHLTAIDLVIDPVAVETMGLWEWHGSGGYYGIPLSNFAGWFFVSLVAHAGFAWIAPEARPPRTAEAAGLSIVVFFCIAAYGSGLLVAGTAGVILCAAHLALRPALFARASREKALSAQAGSVHPKPNGGSAGE